ncbi:MAG: type II secretion system F family protein [Phascolarctobacterium sp.]|nr:type II secretion system F family protein [Phascolarctobacterium sp.]
MLILISLMASLCLFIVLYVIIQAMGRKQDLLKSRLRGLNSGEEQKLLADAYWRENMKRSLYERTVKSFADKIAAKLAKLTPASFRAQAEELVDQTNNFNGMGLSGFMLFLGASTVFFLLLGLWLVYSRNLPLVKGFLIFAAFIVAGMYVPFFVLRQMVEERREAIRQSMPDVLDLLCVSVQAGLGFDGAMGKVTAKMKGPLIEEFERLLQELRMGITRRNALNRLAKRCGIEEMKLFTAALIQAEKLGVGTAQVLEIQSENMREMRRQRAKEKAAKLPVNIIFPTTVFIFPALFIVVLGPAIVTIMKTFSK